MESRKRINGLIILITGATGFLGSRLIECLVNGEYEDDIIIRALCRTPNKFKGFSQNKVKVEPVKGDIMDKDSIKSAIKDVDLVMLPTLSFINNLFV